MIWLAEIKTSRYMGQALEIGEMWVNVKPTLPPTTQLNTQHNIVAARVGPKSQNAGPFHSSKFVDHRPSTYACSLAPWSLVIDMWVSHTATFHLIPKHSQMDLGFADLITRKLNMKLSVKGYIHWSSPSKSKRTQTHTLQEYPKDT